MRSDTPAIRRDLAAVLVSFALYLCGVAINEFWRIESLSVQPLWLSTSMAVTLALLLRPRFTIAVIVGALAAEVVNATVVHDAAWFQVVGSTLANGVEIVMAIIVFRRIADPERGIVRVRQALGWMIASVAIAGIGAGIALSMLVLDGPDRWREAVQWWSGDAITFSVVCPIGLLRRQYMILPFDRQRKIELAAVSGAAIVCFGFTYWTDSLLFLGAPLLAWLAVSFGFRASTPAVAIATMWSVFVTTQGRGPFSDAGSVGVQVDAFDFANGGVNMVLAALATKSALASESLSEALDVEIELRDQVRAVRADERDRIAQRLHDEAIQVLTAADLQLSSNVRQLDDDQRSIFDVTGERIRRTIVELRDVVTALTPPKMDGRAVVFGLSAVADTFESEGGPTIDVVAEAIEGLDPASGNVIYQVAREAVSNAVRHANATHVVVTLQDHSGQIEVRVEDDGVGFEGAAPVDSVGGHLGVRLMHERVMSIGGSLRISGGTNGGTVVSAVVPRVVSMTRPNSG